MNELIKNNKNARAAIYIRVSTEDQQKGYGPKMQREETVKAATERDGCTIQENHIIDDSISGSSHNRPGWKKLLEIAKRGDIDVVYFWKLDRMMRDEYFFYMNENELKKCGVDLRFATQDLSDPFNRGIQVVVAADERRKIMQRTYGGRIRAVKDGKWVCQPPMGYDINDKTGTLKINQREAKNIKQLFTWLVEDRLSLTALAKRAYAYHIPTKFDVKKRKKYKYGRHFWSKGALGRLLSRDYYATGVAHFCKVKRPRQGKVERRPQAEWLAVSVPPIISKDIFEKVQKQLLRNSKFARRKTKRQYLFAKRLRCKICNGLLTANCRTEREGDKFYRNDVWSEKKCPECVYFRERDLDSAVWDSMNRFFSNPSMFMNKLDKIRKRGSKQQQIEEERQNLATAEEKIFREEKILLDHELSSLYSTRVISEKRKEIESRRKDIDERKQELEKLTLMEERRLQSITSAEKLYKRMKEKLENPTYTIKQRVYGLLVDKILLNRTSAEVWINVPKETTFPYFMAGIVEKTGAAGHDQELLSRTPYS
jgi:site-specific DNA recombinase